MQICSYIKGYTITHNAIQLEGGRSCQYFGNEAHVTAIRAVCIGKKQRSKYHTERAVWN